MKPGKIIVVDPNDPPEDRTPLGIADVRLCESKDHDTRVALILAHWVTGPIDYCLDCAGRILAIADALGYHCHTEPIAYPEIEALIANHRQSRGIALEGVPK